jgi:hypothetical protein
MHQALILCLHPKIEGLSIPEIHEFIPDLLKVQTDHHIPDHNADTI